MIKHIFYNIFVIQISVFNLFAFEYEAYEILDSMIISLNPFSSKSMMKKEIIKSNQITHISTFESYSNQFGTDVMIKYIEPENISSNAFLSINDGDEIWVYNSKLNRSRKIINDAKFENLQGGDFTYFDFSGKGRWRVNYKIKKINSNDKKHYLLLLKPLLNEKTKYDSLKVYINKSSYYPDRVLYYKNNIKFKTLRFKELVDIQGINTSMLLNMKNHLNNSETNIRIKEIIYNINFDKNFFSKENIISH